MTTAFRHVANRMLASMLEAEPRHVSPPDLGLVLGWTLDALGRDVIDESVPPEAIAARIEATRAADAAIKRCRWKQAHAAMQRFWMS